MDETGFQPGNKLLGTVACLPTSRSIPIWVLTFSDLQADIAADLICRGLNGPGW